MNTQLWEENFLWPKAKTAEVFRKSDFVEAVSKYYYVDKSLLIKDLIDNDNGDDAFLFTRPRRFG